MFHHAVHFASKLGTGLYFIFRLKRLALVLLSRLIQDGSDGHCSLEDALATMEIFLLVKSNWEKENPDLAGDNLFDDRYWAGDNSDDDFC